MVRCAIVHLAMLGTGATSRTKSSLNMAKSWHHEQSSWLNHHVFQHHYYQAVSSLSCRDIQLCFRTSKVISWPGEAVEGRKSIKIAIKETLSWLILCSIMLDNANIFSSNLSPSRLFAGSESVDRSSRKPRRCGE